MKTTRLRVLGIVPARGGSKSIPRKNLRLLGEYPLLAYAIAAGSQARLVDRVIVSTDDPEIADVARQHGAEVPFLRPAPLATDSAPDLPLFRHALDRLEADEGYRPDIVVQLRPTSPLRPPGLVDAAIEALLADPTADCARSVTRPTQNPFKMWKDGPAGSLVPLVPTDLHEPYNMPRQALPRVYWQTGHVDAIRTSTILEQESLTGRRVVPVLCDPAYCVDIDHEADLQLAEWRLGRLGSEVVRPDASGDRPALGAATLLVLDFDGVLTDDRVWITETGVEAVVCSRGDGMGIERLRGAGVEIVVISKEVNPVVRERCRKLNVACHHGIERKEHLLRELVEARGLSLEHVVYVGNDINDLGCMRMVGWPIAVADAHPEVAAAARIVLARPGGRGAVREIADLILSLRNRE